MSSKKCKTRLPCGHQCPLALHPTVDPDHENVLCEKPCERTKCTAQSTHKCKLLCYEECKPCDVLVDSRFPCGHTCKVYCKDASRRLPIKQFCMQKVIKGLEYFLGSCSVDPKKYTHTERCSKVLTCGHPCENLCKDKWRKSEVVEDTRRCGCKLYKKYCDDPGGLTCPRCDFISRNCLNNIFAFIYNFFKLATSLSLIVTLVCLFLLYVQWPTFMYKPHVELFGCSFISSLLCGFMLWHLFRRQSSCRHQCPLGLHPTVDPDHENVLCEKPCQRTRCTAQSKHKCKLLCYEECKPCDVLVNNRFPCGHTYTVYCKDVARSILCQQKVAKKLTCGHSATVACSIDPKNYTCTERCSKVLTCGHPCKILCKDRCRKCEIVVEKTRHCGCKFYMKCCDDPRGITCTRCDFSLRTCLNNVFAFISNFLRLASRIVLLVAFVCLFVLSVVQSKWPTFHVKHKPLYGFCADIFISSLLCCFIHWCLEYILTLFEPQISLKPQTQNESMVQHLCREVLPCGHTCHGSDSFCRQGRVHESCSEQCGRIKVCGHDCKTPCAQACALCELNCPNSCEHSRCTQICASPCVPCMEPCPWQCRHHKCRLRCWEFCVRPRCDEPCLLKLPCGHSCIGLCGEKCPSLCRLCHRNQLSDFILSGCEDEEDARFIQLEDCGHCIEVDGMDRWMDENDGEIQMKRCPRCKTIIWHSRRYGNIVRKCLQDIEKVKMKLLGGSGGERRLKMDFLLSKTLDMSCHVSGIEEEIQILQNDLSGTFVMSAGRLAVIENQLNMLEFMRTIKIKANKLKTVAGNYLIEDITKLSARLMKNRESLTEFEVQQISREVKRIYLLASAMDVQESLPSPMTLTVDKKKLVHRLSLLFSTGRTLTDQDEAQVEGILKQCKMFSGITVQERVMIVNAMHLRQGHWYKCPKGHVYAIGECGQAMQKAKCPECGASIGGASHRLEHGNTLVTGW